MPNSVCHQLWGKHPLEKGQNSNDSEGKINSVLLRCRFRKIAASPFNEDFKLNLLYCCSPLKKYRQEKKLTVWWKKDISLFPFLQSHCIFCCPICCISLWKGSFWMFFISPRSNLWTTHIGARFWSTLFLSSYSSRSISCFGGKR